MGLRDTFQKAAQTIVRATGDIALDATYQSFASATYDASAGADSVTYSAITGCKLIVGEFSHFEREREAIRPDDRKFLLPVRYLGATRPKPRDRVVTDPGATASANWEVVAAMTDPAEALWELQVRRP